MESSVHKWMKGLVGLVVLAAFLAAARPALACPS
jgi:hypothetical protein